ncbi:MAG: hypothetical protein LBO09_05660 [Candidatus Peribacteria bacterium]|jgi:hypothetical protein|nr:hypothetical protein [Candidatus Peribacteria bacterium]
MKSLNQCLNQYDQSQNLCDKIVLYFLFLFMKPLKTIATGFLLASQLAGIAKVSPNTAVSSAVYKAGELYEVVSTPSPLTSVSSTFQVEAMSTKDTIRYFIEKETPLYKDSS